MREQARCTRHAGARAGWRCERCHAALCPGCVYVHRAGSADLAACTACGSFVQPLRVHRSVVRPFASRIPGALAYPLGVSGLLSLLGLGAVAWLLKKAGLLGALCAAGVWWGFVFNVIRRSAIGDDELGPPDFSDVFDDVVMPAIRGVVATAVLWIPAIAYAGSILAAGATAAEAARDPVVWGLVLLGLAYGPAAIMVAAAGGSFLGLFNPLVGVGLVVRLGRDYALAAASVGVLLLANLGVEVGAALVARTGVPVVSAWLAETLTCFLPVVAARVLGVLLHVRGDAVGYGVAESYLEPALAGALPRGSPPVLETQAAPEPTPVSPIALDDPPASASAASAGPDGIAAAIGAKDLARAGALFAAYRGPDSALPARTLFELARAAADAGHHALSARALHAAGTGDDAAIAPNALLVLARVYERRLARPDDARQVLAYLVARWPASDAARHARGALASTPGAA